MDGLFTALTDAMSGSFMIALLASFAWGVLSILLSPCHLSSIPLIIGFLTARGEKKGSRGLLLSFVFAVGILATIAVTGAITAALGRIMGDVGPYGKYAVAAIFFVVGLYLMDLIRLPETGVALRPLQRCSPYTSALVLGLVFGIALGVAQIHVPDSGEPPHLLFAIQAEGDFAALVSDLNVIFRETLAGQFADIMQLGQGSLDDYFKNQQPFFRR